MAGSSSGGDFPLLEIHYIGIIVCDMALSSSDGTVVANIEGLELYALPSGPA